MGHSVKIVTGLGYGDEGKGITTKWLCSDSHPSTSLVIRFGGGNQVGHTVASKEDGEVKTHVHHHTGSGSTVATSTFYSRFCTVDPIGTLIECEKLTSRKDVFTSSDSFTLYYDPRAMIVTPLDVKKNRGYNKDNHMSVGVGFGTTIQRNEDHHHLYVIDITYVMGTYVVQLQSTLIVKFYDPLSVVNVQPRPQDLFRFVGWRL